MTFMGISELVFKKKSSDILLALAEEPSHVRELRERIGGSASTVQTRIREMKEEELVEESRQDNFPFKKTLKLTELGSDVVDILKNFEGIEQRREIETVTFDMEKERLMWPLLILHKHGQQGNTKIQKLVFLGKHEFDLDIPYKFTPYHHGPFSKELARDMGKLMTLGLVDPLEEKFELSEKGKKIAQQICDELDLSQIRGISELENYSRMSLRWLLNLVYKKYPERSGSPNA